LIKAPFTLEIVLAKIKAAKNALTPAPRSRIGAIAMSSFAAATR
jgi:hypothetical protein